MSINSSVRQISGGVAAFLTGLIVVQQPEDQLEYENTLGLVVIVCMIITILMMRIIDRRLRERLAGKGN